MKRIVTTSLTVSLLALSACKGGAGADAVKLVPDDAEMVMGMSPKTITGSEVYTKFASELEKEDEYKEGMAALEKCNIKPKEFEAVVIAANASSENFLVVMAGSGVGKEDNATCAIKEMQKMDGDEEKAEVTTEGGHKLIKVDDEVQVFLVTDDMVALVSEGWRGKVVELLDGKGTPAIEGSKKELYGKVDTKAAVWFFADVPADAAGNAALISPEATKVKTIAGNVDLSKGVGVDVVAGFGSEDEAKAVAEAAQKALTEYKPMIPAGLSGVVESVKIEASGSELKLGVSATMDDIDAAKTMLEAM